MSAPTSFDDAKAILLSGLSDTQESEDYHSLLQSTDYEQLLRSECNFIAWNYQANVMTDEWLSAIDTPTLNLFGIYTSDVTLTNPTGYDVCGDIYINDERAPELVPTIYIFGTANATINISNGLKYNIYLMGSGSTTINLTNDSSAVVRMFNDATCTCSISGSGVLDFTTNQNTSAIVTANNNCSIYGSLRDSTSISYTGNDSTAAKFKTYISSTLTYTLNNSATITFNQYQKSTIINGAP